MDALLSSLKRQYIAEPSDELAHQISRNLVRAEPSQLTFSEKLDNFNETIEALNAELGDQLDKALVSLIVDDVEAIRWEQYTPYFNDGDACIFVVSEPRVRFKGDPVDIGYFADGFVNINTYGRYARVRVGTELEYEPIDSSDEEAVRRLEIIRNIVKFFFKIPESLLLSQYDDHQIVIVTSEGVECEFYEHD